MEEFFSRISHQNIRGERRRDLDNQIILRLRVWLNQTGRENKRPMHIHRYRRRVYGVLSFSKRISRTGRNTNNFPRTDRQTIEFKHPTWLDEIIIVTKENIEEHEKEVKETMKKLEEAGYRLQPKICDFFQKEAE